MAFTPVTEAAFGDLVVSNTVTVAASPVTALCPITVRGEGDPQLQINESGDWLVHAVARHDDTVRLRLTSSTEGLVARTATLYFKGGNLPFTVTTASP